jgi:hypothetical protein
VKTLHLPVALLVFFSSIAVAEDYVYVLPDGSVQWGPNVRATKTKLSDLPEPIQRELLAQKANTPTMRERLEKLNAIMRPVLADKPATAVRILLVCDTQAAGGIATGVGVDLARMQAFFTDAFRNRPNTCFVDVLSGPTLTADKALKHYSQLRSAPTETLVFYYSGHGAQTPVGHALAFSDGTVLQRKALLDAMHERPHQAVIVLTDCCSNTTAVDFAALARNREAIKQILGNDLPLEIPQGVDARTIEWLFLRHKGTIDLTAATPTRGQLSWNSDQTGGFFTYSLVRALRTDVNLINSGQRERVENQVTWQMAFNRIQTGAGWMSLGRRGAPPLAEFKKNPRDRDKILQWAHAYSFHEREPNP